MIAALSKKRDGQIEFGIIYGGIALLALFASRFLPVFSIAPACAFKALFGLPCPTCGSTRSLVYLSRTDFSSAFLMNPLIALCAAGAVLWLLYSVITLVFGLPRIGLTLTESEKDIFRISAVLIALMNWLFIIVTV